MFLFFFRWTARPIGCFRDTGRRAIPQMDGRDVLVRGFYRRRLFAIVKCAAVAKKRGYRAFAVQHQGWCATGPRAHVTYRKYGRSTKCRNGKGGPWANDVYFLSGMYLRKSGWSRMFLNQFSVLTTGACFSKVPKLFGTLFGPWFGCHNSLYLYLHYAEVLSRQTSQSSWFFLQ